MDKPLWKQALELEHFIRAFVPPGWKDTIEQVMFVPWLSENDNLKIKDGIIPMHFEKEVFKLAIRAYLLGGN